MKYKILFIKKQLPNSVISEKMIIDSLSTYDSQSEPPLVHKSEHTLIIEIA